MKARDILTAVVLMLAHIGSTAKFVAAGEGDIKGDIVVNPNNRYAPSKLNVSNNADLRQKETS